LKKDFDFSLCITKVFFQSSWTTHFVHSYEQIFGYFMIFYPSYGEIIRNWFISMNRVCYLTILKNDCPVSFFKTIEDTLCSTISTNFLVISSYFNHYRMKQPKIGSYCWTECAVQLFRRKIFIFHFAKQSYFCKIIENTLCSRLLTIY
jgi:hypothetical protein